MKRLTLAFLLLAALLCPVAAIAQPVTVIGPITPGDCTAFNSTTVLKDAGFSCSGGTVIFSGDVLFGSGRPWCDIRAQGAKQDGVTNDNGAFTACNSVLAALGGGIIYVPPSPNASCLKSGGITPGQGVVIQGAGNGYGNSNPVTVQSSSPSRVSACGVDNTLINVANASSGFSGLDIEGLPFGTQPAVTVATSRSIISYNNINGGSIALKYTGGADNILIGNRISQAYGTANLYVGSGAINAIRNLTNQTWNGQAPTAHSITSVSAWQASTSYSTGNLATITFSGVSYYIQVLSSTGNSGLSQPTEQPYGVNIVDNNVIWRLRAPVGLYCTQYDGAGTSLEYNHDHSGACIGVGLTNNSQQVFITGGYFGDNLGDGISAASGSNLEYHGGAMNGCKFTTCAEIRFTSGWTGPAIIDGVSFWTSAIGVSVEGGTNVRIIGNSVFGATLEAINVAANITDVTAQGNSLGTDTNLGTNANAAILGAGTDYIIFSSNNCHGATAGLTNNGSGAHNYIPSGGNPGC
jgi:hypothetical protein